MNTNLEIVSNHIEECIKTIFKNDSISSSNFFMLTIKSIEYLENEYTELSGPEKQKLLIEAFNDLCDLSKHESLNPEIREKIKEFINNDLEIVINSVIDISKGNYSINENHIGFCIQLFKMISRCSNKKKIIKNP